MDTKLKDYLSLLVGAKFHKSYNFIPNDHLAVEYFSSYEEFKKANPESNVSKEDYENYYAGSQEDKILVGEPIRILREFPELNKITFETPTKHIHVFRSKLNDYIGQDITKLVPKEEPWIKLIEKYIYNKQEREKYLSHFECSLKY